MSGKIETVSGTDQFAEELTKCVREGYACQFSAAGR